uniref:T-cell surface glycoprotein CD8 alpha chain n=1 Tax=Sander lucioperca TaxID=283035 RepID=A0A8C9XLS5_SANLU
IKMDQKWIPILVILVFCQKMTSGAGEDIVAKEGEQVEITCKPHDMGSMVIWFRVLDTSGMEFIASFSSIGLTKSTAASFPSTFSNSKIQQNILILKSFNKAQDSGVYCCAALKNNGLKFGITTRLVGGDTCFAGETSPQMFCTPIILGPLAGGCGLLLLLLIISTVYCNRKFIGYLKRCCTKFNMQSINVFGKLKIILNAASVPRILFVFFLLLLFLI